MKSELSRSEQEGPVTSLEEILERAKKHKSSIIILTAAHDINALLAIKQAMEVGLSDKAVLIGDKSRISQIGQDLGLTMSDLEIVDEQDEIKATQLAIARTLKGENNFLMKGLIQTADLLRVLLHSGIKRELLSQVAIFEFKSQNRLIFLTDTACNISPSVDEKFLIAKNASKVARALGITQPKVAAISAVDYVHGDIKSSVEAKLLQDKNDEALGFVIGGPFSLESAISPRLASHRGSSGSIAGNADILLAPNIETGNILSKGLSFIAGFERACVLMGAEKPVILTSRSDSSKSRLYAIALASIMADA